MRTLVIGVADVVDGGRRVVMCHYPLMTWPGRESYMVHGHIHDDTRGAYWPLLASYDNALNAGVDVNGFEPCTLDELVENNRAWREGVPVVRLRKAVEQCIIAGTPTYLLEQAVENGLAQGFLAAAEADELNEKLEARHVA